MHCGLDGGYRSKLQKPIASPYPFIRFKKFPNLCANHWSGSESGSGSCSFLQWLLRWQQVFLLITYRRYIYILVFKNNKLLRSHKTVLYKSYLFCLLTEGSDPDPRQFLTNYYGSKSGSGRARNLRILQIQILSTSSSPSPFISLLFRHLRNPESQPWQK